MSVVSPSSFKESGMVSIFFKFLALCNDKENFLRGEDVLSRGKKQQSIGTKSFQSSTLYGLKYEKTTSVNYLLSFF